MALTHSVERIPIRQGISHRKTVSIDQTRDKPYLLLELWIGRITVHNPNPTYLHHNAICFRPPNSNGFFRGPCATYFPWNFV